MQIVVTGASGYIGSRLCSKLIVCGFDVTGIMRSPSAQLHKAIKQVTIDITNPEGLEQALFGQDVVIHLAGLAHQTKSQTGDEFARYQAINTKATLDVAKMALAANVKHFIYFSSIHVNGKNSNNGRFTVDSVPQPQGPYAVSKLKAEVELQELAGSTDMTLTIIRPTLVYGPNAPGNMKKLLRIVKSGCPLPLAGLDNRKSFIALENLISFVLAILGNREKAKGLFLLADNEIVSTTDLIDALAKGMNKRPFMFRLPDHARDMLNRIPGISGPLDQLCSSLEVDNSHARKELDWNPVVQTRAGLRKMAKMYAKNIW